MGTKQRTHDSPSHQPFGSWWHLACHGTHKDIFCSSPGNGLALHLFVIPLYPIPTTPSSVFAMQALPSELRSLLLCADRKTTAMKSATKYSGHSRQSFRFFFSICFFFLAGGDVTYVGPRSPRTQFGKGTQSSQVAQLFSGFSSLHPPHLVGARRNSGNTGDHPPSSEANGRPHAGWAQQELSPLLEPTGSGSLLCWDAGPAHHPACPSPNTHTPLPSRSLGTQEESQKCNFSLDYRCNAIVFFKHLLLWLPCHDEL